MEAEKIFYIILLIYLSEVMQHFVHTNKSSKHVILMSMTLSLGPLSLLQLEIVAKYGHPGAQTEGDEGEEDDHEDLHYTHHCPHHCHHDECHHSRHPLRQEGRCPEGREHTEVSGVQGEVEQDSQVTPGQGDGGVG